jgi:hypothetical protein
LVVHGHESIASTKIWLVMVGVCFALFVLFVEPFVIVLERMLSGKLHSPTVFVMKVIMIGSRNLVDTCCGVLSGLDYELVTYSLCLIEVIHSCLSMT